MCQGSTAPEVIMVEDGHDRNYRAESEHLVGILSYRCQWPFRSCYEYMGLSSYKPLTVQCSYSRHALEYLRSSLIYISFPVSVALNARIPSKNRV